MSDKKSKKKVDEKMKIENQETKNVLDSDLKEGDLVEDNQDTTEEISDDKAKETKDAKDIKIEDLNDKLMRSIAEFENFRKRSEKEKSNMFAIGAKTVLEAILPVIDNFERGLNSIEEEEKKNSFAQGIEMVYKQLMGILDGLGVKPIEAVGQPFNPDFHNAVMHEDNDEYDENIVVEEFIKGYTYNDTVIRYSTVKVVN